MAKMQKVVQALHRTTAIGRGTDKPLGEFLLTLHSPPLPTPNVTLMTGSVRCEMTEPTAGLLGELKLWMFSDFLGPR